MPEQPSYKFPKLKDKYTIFIAAGDSEEEALKKAEQKRLDKHLYNPLDKILITHWIEKGGYKFEVEAHILDRKYEHELSEAEKLRIKSTQSKLLFVDDKKRSLEQLTNAARNTGLYKIKESEHPIDGLKQVITFSPDVLILRHNMSGKNGLWIMYMLRDVGIQQKAIIHGDAQKDIIEKYRQSTAACYFIKEPALSKQTLDAVENVLNGITATTYEEFFIP